jgi:hypothetical protein
MDSPTDRSFATSTSGDDDNVNNMSTTWEMKAQYKIISIEGNIGR